MRCVERGRWELGHPARRQGVWWVKQLRRGLAAQLARALAAASATRELLGLRAALFHAYLPSLQLQWHPLFTPTPTPWCPTLSGPRAEAKGKTVPPAGDVKKVESQICGNPKTAAQQLTKALQAGGPQAQHWVYALFDANCGDPNAPADTYQVSSRGMYFTTLPLAAAAGNLPACLADALVFTSSALGCPEWANILPGGAGALGMNTHSAPHPLLPPAVQHRRCEPGRPLRPRRHQGLLHLLCQGRRRRGHPGEPASHARAAGLCC